MSITDLPAIGQPLDGGTFAGLTTKPDGAHGAVVLLPDNGTDLTWAKAKAWAKEQGGDAVFHISDRDGSTNLRPHSFQRIQRLLQQFSFSCHHASFLSC